MSESGPERWDAIVVGSGLGGLSTAAYLCAAGKRTLVLEGHYIAGGNSQVFRRDVHGRRYEFDVGVHYIGECGRGGVITSALNGVGLAERVIFRPMDTDGYSTLVFPDFTFRVPVGWDRYRARLLETFPDEAEPLGRVVDILREVATAGRGMTRGEIELANLATDAPTFAQWGLAPVTSLFEKHGLSAQASAVLLGEQGDYAVRPSKTPVAVAAGVNDHFLHGAFYPEGGGQVIAGRLIEAIRSYGGEVRTRSRVERIRVEGGKAKGVVMAKTGEEIDAPIVVSNADLKRTVLELVGEEHFAPETVERVRAYRMSLPLYCVYIGLDSDLASELPNTNYWIWGTYDIEGNYDCMERGELPQHPGTYVTLASTKDPTSPHVAPAGHTNLQIMAVVPREYSVWNVERGPAEGGRYHRDPDYRARKNELMEKLIEVADRAIPGIADHIDWQEAATPVSQERFTRSTGGTAYGIELSLDQAGPLRMGPKTEISGLYLCGASTPSGPGVASVIRSGVVAAGSVLDRNLLSEVLAGNVIGDRDALPPLREDWDAWKESH